MHPPPDMNMGFSWHLNCISVFGSGPPIPGAVVEGTLTGPGVSPPGTAMGTTDTNGQVLLSFDIFAFGTYTFTIDRVLIDDAEVDLGAESELMQMFTVGATCTPPSGCGNP